MDDFSKTAPDTKTVKILAKNKLDCYILYFNSQKSLFVLHFRPLKRTWVTTSLCPLSLTTPASATTSQTIMVVSLDADAN